MRMRMSTSLRALACMCMVLAISAVMWSGFVGWKMRKRITQKMTELEERTEAAEYKADALWEAVVMLGGFLSRMPGEALTAERRQELLIEEDDPNR